MTKVQRATDRVTGSKSELNFPAKSQTAAFEFRAFRATRLMNYLSPASASTLDSVMGINDKREGNCSRARHVNNQGKFYIDSEFSRLLEVFFHASRDISGFTIRGNVFTSV